LWPLCSIKKKKKKKSGSEGGPGVNEVSFRPRPYCNAQHTGSRHRSY
jgi:hypothetical protein